MSGWTALYELNTTAQFPADDPAATGRAVCAHVYVSFLGKIAVRGYCRHSQPNTARVACGDLHRVPGDNAGLGCCVVSC